VDEGEFGELGASEIEEIAKAGGGLSRLSTSRQLSQTVQMMTRQAVTQTIQQAVHKQLHHIFGNQSLEALPPDQRGQVVRVMDDMGETAGLKVALLIDASASMKPKFAAVEEAIRDLMLSLQSRQGRSELSVFHFPGSPGSGKDIEMDVAWTTEIRKIQHLFQKINMRGTTPTGPAMLKVVQYITEGRFSDTEEVAVSLPVQADTVNKGGMLSDYVV
jgi:Ca-activated chloride channel family protein